MSYPSDFFHLLDSSNNMLERLIPVSQLQPQMRAKTILPIHVYSHVPSLFHGFKLPQAGTSHILHSHSTSYRKDQNEIQQLSLPRSHIFIQLVWSANLCSVVGCSKPYLSHTNFHLLGCLSASILALNSGSNSETQCAHSKRPQISPLLI